MSDPIEQLVEALRNELQQYGETLALLDAPDESPSPSSGINLIPNAFNIVERQRAAIAAAQAQRKISESHLAWSLGHPDFTSPAELIPLAPENYQPLLKALLSETEELLQRVSEQARLSQCQLQKTHTLMQQFIDGLGGEITVTVETRPAPDHDRGDDLPMTQNQRIASQ